MLEKPPSWGGQELQPAGGEGHHGKAAGQGGGAGAHSALSGHWLPREGWILNIRQLAWAPVVAAQKLLSQLLLLSSLLQLKLLQ